MICLGKTWEEKKERKGKEGRRTKIGGHQFVAALGPNRPARMQRIARSVLSTTAAIDRIKSLLYEIVIAII
jgi:hypothetical protein